MNAADEYEQYKEANFKTWKKKHWAEAELKQMQPCYEQSVLKMDASGVLYVEKAVRCPHWKQRGPAWPYEQCKNSAGYRTTHEGFGKCYRCDGHNGRGLMQGAILMALAYADELNVTPWEALLSQCRLLANQVEWLRVRVYDYERTGGVEALKPGGEGFWAVDMLEQRGDRLAKVAKSCIDAGIAQQMVSQINLEAEHMAKAAMAGMDEIGLEGEQRDRLLEVMSAKLLELESTGTVI